MQRDPFTPRTREEAKILDNPNVVRWYATNLHPSHVRNRKMEPHPLGINHVKDPISVKDVKR